MEIDHLREFVELARICNFTKAAGRLGISRTALSKHIAGIEREFGVEIFERDNLHTELTAAGRQLLKGAQVTLDSWDGLHAQMEAFRKSGPMRLKVGLFRGHKPTDDMVDTVTKSLHDQGVLIDVEVVDVKIPCFQGLRDSEFDIISPVHADDVDLTGLTDRLFVEEPLVAIVPAGNPLASKGLLSPHDLDGNVVLTVHDGAIVHFFHTIETLLTRLDVHPRYVTMPYTDWGSFNRSLANAQGGICLVHASMARWSMPLVSTSFTPIRFDSAAMKIPVYLTWRSNDTNPAVDLFTREFFRITALSDMQMYWR